MFTPSRGIGRMKRILALLVGAALCVAIVPIGVASATGDLKWAERSIPGLDGEVRSVEFTHDGSVGHILERTATSNRLWTTENGGATWTESSVYPTGGFMGLGDSIEIMDIAWDGTGQYGWAVGVFKDYTIGMPSTTDYNPYILYTANGGKIWASQTVNIDTDLTDEGSLNAVHNVAGADVYACGENGMILATVYSGNGADAWEVLRHDQSGETYNDVTGAHVPGAKRAICVGDDGRLIAYDYSISGNTWGAAGGSQLAAAGTDLNAVAVPDLDEDRVFAVGSNGFYAWSNNDGGVWTSGDTGDETWNGLDSKWPDTGHAYAVGDSGETAGFSYASIPQTWSSYGLFPTNVTEDLEDVSSVGGGHLWAGGDSGVVVQRARSASDRVADGNRYTTAIAMSSDWPDDSCNTVVLATGLDFPDALSASALAGAYECPLLLTGATLDTKVKNELNRLGASTVVIIGGTGAVPAAVSDALTSSGFTVDRISGVNRYRTSQAVAEKVAAVEGSDFSKQAFMARGDGFADALAVSPFAYSQKMPVLLTDTARMPDPTKDAVKDLDIEQAVIAGGTGAVSDDVMAALDVLVVIQNGGYATLRWDGTDRYKTAAEIAREGIKKGWGTPAVVGLATGENFPDALGGGAVCGSSGGVMLLTSSSALSGATGTFLDDFSGDIMELKVFGGESAVAGAVMFAADAKVD